MTGIMPGESASHLDPDPCGLAGRELEHAARAAAPRRPPGAEVGDDLADAELPVEEDGVDREAHEERVDRRRLRDQQPLARLEARAAEQPPHPGGHRARDLAALADDPALLVDERVRGRSSDKRRRVREQDRDRAAERQVRAVGDRGAELTRRAASRASAQTTAGEDPERERRDDRRAEQEAEHPRELDVAHPEPAAEHEREDVEDGERGDAGDATSARSERSKSARSASAAAASGA